MKDRRSYARNQSRLYKVKCPRQLASVLQLEKHNLDLLTQTHDNYIRWTDKKTGRAIQRPKPLLEKVHRRVCILMSRIETPDYLYSAVKGRSYIDNAACHTYNQPTLKIDIRKFFPSVRVQAVFHLFRDRMLCAGDVAGILAKLLTVDGHLATGSSASPILSYFAYEDMFAEIEVLASQYQCVMTCYVDDMVITGNGATKRILRDIIEIVSSYRLWGHKTKVFKAGQPKIITGVVVTKVGLKLPNRRKHLIMDEKVALGAARTDKERLLIMRGLTGRLYEAKQIDIAWHAYALRMSSAYHDLKRSTSV